MDMERPLNWEDISPLTKDQRREIATRAFERVKRKQREGAWERESVEKSLKSDCNIGFLRVFARACDAFDSNEEHSGWIEEARKQRDDLKEITSR